MNTIWRNHFEKLLAAFGLALVAIGLVWSCEMREPRTAPRALERKTAFGPAVFRRKEADNDGPPGLLEWTPPVAQPRGAGWVFELFTPPAIRRDPVTGNLTLVLPVGEAPDGLELLAVHRDLFRLQLAGYFGPPDKRTATFVCPGRPGTILAHAGTRLQQLGLVFRRFEIMPSAAPAGDPSNAGAVLLDEKTGTEIMLGCGLPALTDTLVAVLRVGPAGAKSLELREGDAFCAMRCGYRVERISLDPSEIAVIKTDPGPAPPMRCVLRNKTTNHGAVAVGETREEPPAPARTSPEQTD